MNKQVWTYLLQLVFVVVLYSVLSQYVSDVILVVVTIAMMVIFMAYNLFYKWSGETKLEVACNPRGYLEYVERKYKKQDEYYHLHKAYGSLYNGDIDIARDSFGKINDLKLLEDRNLYIIYNKVKAQLAYYDNNEELLVDLIDEVGLSPLKTELMMSYLNTLLLLVRKDYTALVEQLFDSIPKQLKRFHIIELEYYLAVAYVGLDKMEDANAVLEFMIKKGHPIIFTKKCRDLHEEINNK